MPFVDTAYGYLALICLLAIALEKNKEKLYGKSLLATINVSLIFYVIYQCYDYYQFYKMAEMFGVSISFKGLLKLMSTNKWEAFKNIAVLIIPFVFLFQKLSANIILTIAMLVLIKWPIFEKWYQKIAYSNISYSTYKNEFTTFQILNYGC
ncbi:MAG: hypothetical protein H7101_08780, partial [Deinococcales bacterium]|nr:hypothetical protein [Chitinophagaceae bacterium]